MTNKPSSRSQLVGVSSKVAAMLADVARAIDRGNLASAERTLLGVMALAPDHSETWRVRALLERRAGRRSAAIEAAERALASTPDAIELLGLLGELRSESGDAEGGLALLKRRTELQPDNADGWFQLGVACDRAGLHDEAIAAGERTLALAPKHPVARLLLARNLQALGRIEDTAAQLRTLIAARSPRAWQAWFSLVDLKTVPLAPAEVAALEKAAADPRQDAGARATLDFALGNALEAAGRHDAAFAALVRANRFQRGQERWDRDAFARLTGAIRTAFDPPLIGANADLGRETIFIVGLPRSGTTLVEQVLAAHAEVEGGSELPDVPAVIQAESQRRGLPFPQWVATTRAEDWERLGRDYLARTARWRAGKPRSTDKLPQNWLYVGALRRMLPAARIVVAWRDPLETCWSCFKQMFAPNLAAFAYDFDDLAAYAGECRRLCEHWQAAWPEAVRIQSHEALLAEPESEIRALLAFCGLAFDPACLSPHTAERGVRSASAAQVRQPMRAPVAKTAAYGDRLRPLREALAAAGL